MKRHLSIRKCVLVTVLASLFIFQPLYSYSILKGEVAPPDYFPGLIPFVDLDAELQYGYLEYYSDPDIGALQDNFYVAEDISYLLEDHPSESSLMLFFERYSEALDDATVIFENYIPVVELNKIDHNIKMFKNIKKKLTLDTLEYEGNVDVTMREAIPEGVGKIEF